MQYCIYLRKSRKDIESELYDNCDTLSRHEKILLNLAKNKKLNITKIFREVVSGENIYSRPEMQKLLHEVEQQNWDGVLVMEIERLARGNTIDQGIVAQTFKISNTKIITPFKTFDPNNEYDEEYFEFGLFMSRREYKTINRRLQRGRLTSVNEGKWLGSIAPYGYNKIKLNQSKGYSLEIVRDQAEIVKTIFNLFAYENCSNDYSIKSYGLSSIAAQLNSWSIPSPKNNKWSPSTIRDILKNPVYIGKIRWNARPKIKHIQNGQISYSRPRANSSEWILVDGLHAPIINNHLWNTAQLKFSNSNKTYSFNNNIKNPLSGLLICGICGHKLIRKSYKNYPDILSCPTYNCSNVSSKLSLVEKRLITSLNMWITTLKFSKSVNSIDFSSSQIDLLKKKTLKKINKEIEQLHTQLNNIYDFLEQEIYSQSQFEERLNHISTKITQLESSKIKLSTETEKKVEHIPNSSNVISFQELYNTTNDISLKNQLLKCLVNKVIYIKNENGRWGNEDNFELTVYPKLPKDYY